MTNASAMMLVLLVFIALLVGALVVVLCGGGLFERRHNRGHVSFPHDHQRAA